MTGFNLPPGCNVSDIPGNRPEDAEWEAIVENFFDKERLIKNPTGGFIISEKEYAEMDALYKSKHSEVIDNYIAAAIEYGRNIGSKEGYEAAQENAMYDRMAHFEYRIPYLRQYFKALRERAKK